MNLRTYLLLVAAAVAITGLAFLVAVPVNLYLQDGTTVDCGTALNRNDQAATRYNLDQLTNEFAGRRYSSDVSCDGPINQRLEWSIPLAVAGAVISIGALIGRRKTTNSQ